MNQNVFIRKLEGFGPLSEIDRKLLDKVTSKSRLVPARTDIIREGESSTEVRLILEGFACRYKITSQGDRHIMAYLLPGDMCDHHVFILEKMDHTIATLSPCRVVDIPRTHILELTERPAIARALWWATLVDEAVLREWLVNIGQRDASERIAHLLCELFVRLKAVGLASGHTYDLPITQIEIGDTMGLSTVHANRAIQALRELGLITMRGGKVSILDAARLQEYSGFTANYLHLTSPYDNL